jgi:hypothetical protein
MLRSLRNRARLRYVAVSPQRSSRHANPDTEVGRVSPRVATGAIHNRSLGSSRRRTMIRWSHCIGNSGAFNSEIAGQLIKGML